MAEIWRKCSQCKKDIPINSKYYVCSVSTCRTKVTDYAFCSVECWDGHIPIERHRGDSAYAIEKRASGVSNPEPKRILVNPSSGSETKSSSNDEILVVVSKVRKYIADHYGMNTSAGVYDVLTERIKRICDRSVEEAKRQGRKTIMDRDVP